MSEGPIKAWRDGWLPPKTVPRGEAVCASSDVKGRGVCGLSKPAERISDDWGAVTCPECQAARRADEEQAS